MNNKSVLNFFSHEKVSDSLILFTEGYSMTHRFSIGVIEGTEKIMVVDAGLGMSGDFRKRIVDVVGTDKPMICCCTHGHIDHIASAIQFEQAYLGEEDIPDLARNLDFKRRMSDLAAFSLNTREVVEYGREHAIHNENSAFLPIHDGDVFDLGGGVVIECIAVPGHSAGSIAYFNRNEKYVLVGDAINADCHLKRLDRKGFADFAKTLERFLDITGDDFTFYSGHLPVPQKPQIVRDLIEGAKELSEGKMETDVPFCGIFGSQTTPKKADGRFHISGNALIVYNPALCDPDGMYDINNVCYFGHEKISEHVHIVTENYSVVHRQTIGVIEGEDRILVIGSGLGANPGLKNYIEAITGVEKHLQLALTSAALENIGGVSLFDTVYIHPEERKSIPHDDDLDMRIAMLYSYCIRDTTIVDHQREKFLPLSGVTYSDIIDGDILDLGGVQVRAICLPGSSVGAMCYMVEGENILFTGNAINADIFLKDLDAGELEKYSRNLFALYEKINHETVIYSQHLNRGQRAETILNLAKACHEIYEGKTAGDPPGHGCLIWEDESEDVRLHYYGNACVIYTRK